MTMPYLKRISLLAAAGVSAMYMGAAAAGYTVYPIPRSITAGSGEIAFPTSVNIVADESLPENVVPRAREVLERNGITVTTSAAVTPGVDLVIAVNGSKSAADSYATSMKLPRSVFPASANHFDPHVVSLTSSGDFIVLGDEGGSAYYGLATLEQILDQARDAATLTPFTVEDYCHTRYRGIVEGFYGHPFTMESRLDIFDYCKRYKMNFYLYAPKSDPYHTGYWRDPYPETVTDQQRTMGMISSADLSILAKKAKECNIDFVWACHPSLHQSIDFNNLDPGVEQLISKFEKLHELGIRHFGVSIDDMPNHPLNQWELGDKVQTAVEKRFNGEGSKPADRVGNVVFVPSQYAIDFGTSALGGFKKANPNLEMVFTGHGCWSHMRSLPFDQFSDLVGRDPIMWWNNPVNDNIDDFIFMHGLSKRWHIEDKQPIAKMKGLMLNPMNQGQISKIAFFNGADYAWNPATYDEQTSWEHALKTIGRTEEMTTALHDFIMCLSDLSGSSDVNPGNELYKPLYDQCKSALLAGTATKFPELREKMALTLDACRKLRTMSESDVESDRLFYIDIEPWLNKVEEMADIVGLSLDLISGDFDPANWMQATGLVSREKAIHTAQRYRHSHLEGSGTSTYMQWSEVKPTPNSMDNFVKWLAEFASGYAPTLPQRSEEPELITNKPEAPLAQIEKGEDGNVTIGGLADIVLAPTEYVGINFNKLMLIEPVSSPVVPEGVAVQRSISGKEWIDEEFLPGDDNYVETAYIRYYNPGNDSIALKDAENMTFKLPASSVTDLKVSTNMGTWQDYVINNVIDGDKSTYFWSADRQKEGEYVLLDFGVASPRNNFVAVFMNNDKPTGRVEVQASNDNVSWTTIVSFTEADIVNHTYQCSLGGVVCRYVRICFATVSGNNWFQLAEISVDGNSDNGRWTSPALDGNGNMILGLHDRQLSTKYAPLDAGSVTYRFFENLQIEKIQIYHSTEFDRSKELPVVELLDSVGEWREAGRLDEYCTVIDATEATRLSAVRISWNKDNIPVIHEIIPVGEPFVEVAEQPKTDPEPDPVAISGVNADVALKVATGNGMIRVSAAEIVTMAEFVDVTGVVVKRVAPQSTTFTLSVGSTNVGLLRVTFADGRTMTVKLGFIRL